MLNRVSMRFKNASIFFKDCTKPNMIKQGDFFIYYIGVGTYNPEDGLLVLDKCISSVECPSHWKCASGCCKINDICPGYTVGSDTLYMIKKVESQEDGDIILNLLRL